MGSWYATCALTNLPILEDDEVKVVIVRKDKHKTQRGGGFSNPDDNYNPITLPFDAVYDDYGRVRDIDSLGVTELKRINPLDYKGDDFDAGRAIEHILRESYDDYGLYMVRRDIFDRMIAFYISQDEYKYNFREDMNWLHIEKLDSWGVLETDINHRTSLGVYNGALTTEMVTLLVFNAVLEELRRSWEVPTGAGSQAREYGYHKEIAEYVLETIHNEERLNEEDL